MGVDKDREKLVKWGKQALNDYLIKPSSAPSWLEKISSILNLEIDWINSAIAEGPPLQIEHPMSQHFIVNLLANL